MGTHMPEHPSEVFELQIEFVEVELAHFMENDHHDPSQVALAINAAPAAVLNKHKRQSSKKEKKIKAKQLPSTLKEAHQTWKQLSF